MVFSVKIYFFSKIIEHFIAVQKCAQYNSSPNSLGVYERKKGTRDEMYKIKPKI